MAGLVDVLGNCGNIAIWQGDFDYARLKLEESLEIEQMMGYGNLLCLIPYGLLHYRLGDYRQARVYLQKAVDISQKTGNIVFRHFALAHLGYVYLRSGEIDQSYETFVKSLQQYQKVEQQEDLVYSLEGFASLAISLGQAEKAARLIAWADTARASVLNRRPPVEQADVDRDTEIIIEMIGEEAYATAYAEGRMMTADQAIAEALEIEI